MGRLPDDADQEDTGLCSSICVGSTRSEPITLSGKSRSKAAGNPSLSFRQEGNPYFVLHYPVAFLVEPSVETLVQAARIRLAILL